MAHCRAVVVMLAVVAMGAASEKVMEVDWAMPRQLLSRRELSSTKYCKKSRKCCSITTSEFKCTQRCRRTSSPSMRAEYDSKCVPKSDPGGRYILVDGPCTSGEHDDITSRDRCIEAAQQLLPWEKNPSPRDSSTTPFGCTYVPNNENSLTQLLFYQKSNTHYKCGADTSSGFMNGFQCLCKLRSTHESKYCALQSGTGANATTLSVPLGSKDCSCCTNNHCDNCTGDVGFIIGMVALGVCLCSVTSVGARRSHRQRWNLKQQAMVVPTGQPVAILMQPQGALQPMTTMMQPGHGGGQPAMMMQPVQGGGQPAMMMQPVQGGGQPAMMMQPVQGGGQPAMMMQPVQGGGQPTMMMQPAQGGGQPMVMAQPAQGGGQPMVMVQPPQGGNTMQPQMVAQPVNAQGSQSDMII